jgi:CDP-4-dehydro-6-deoxyglucose reductase, E1
MELKTHFMNMKKINLVSDTINKNDISQLINWLSSDEIPRLTKGPKTIEFENKWSTYLGVTRSVFVNSGSSAILLALAALKENNMLKNNKVIVPTLSWLTDVSSPIQLGLEPILCDCNLHDLSLNLDELEVLIKKYNPSCIILVSVLGLVPDMERILALCKQYDIKLIEDVCESMGSEYNGQKLGTFGDVSLFSLYYGHHLSTIEGGLICTNNEELADVIISMRSHGWDRDWSADKQLQFRKKHDISEFDALYTFYYPGYNLRSTDLQAFIGLTQIDKLDNFVTKRKQNFEVYESYLRESNNLKLQVIEHDTISNFAYPYVADSSKHRLKIVNKLIENGIEVRPLIAGSMGLKPFWIKYSGSKQYFKNADLINSNGFYVPNHQDLSKDDIMHISDIILNIK